MGFEAATSAERRRDFARRYVVAQTIAALLHSNVDLATVTDDSSIAELDLGSAFLERLANDFGWTDIPIGVVTLGELADFFAMHYGRDSRVGTGACTCTGRALPA